ncbi:GntR family transcriptional regulator [Kribbella sp. NPDC050124]|uniref:GntR family transcriptional regulator n=1 Tax=Kribbella sp. NPDC050124 TaxID=3364114 RepID=UPI0037A63052
MPQSSSPTPAYVRIAAALREEIRLRPANTLVPSERELSDQHGVSRMTARKAVDLLESEGFVYRRPPRGTFVAEPRLTLRIGSFTEEVVRLGHSPQATVLRAVQEQADPTAAEALGLPDGGEVYVIERLRSADGDAMAIESTIMPAGLAPGLLTRDLTSSLWSLLRREFGVRPERAVARIECLPLEETASTRLGVRQASPGIVLTRHTYDGDGRCIEFATDIYRADRTAFLVSEQIGTID